MQSLIIAFAMYSKIPMPRADWKSENMRLAFCWFPLVGLVIGLIEYAAYELLMKLGAGELLRGAVLTVLPLVITGGIHLDGYMDTSDALGSWGDREKKLAILKDSHIGAFAVIKCAMYMVLTLGLWSQADVRVVKTMIFAFVLERALSGLAAVNFKSARENGMLAAFSKSAEKRIVNVVLPAVAVISALGMLLIWRPWGIMAVVISEPVLISYHHTAMKEFGGTTGDLAGWFLQVCELAMLAGLIILSLLLKEVTL